MDGWGPPAAPAWLTADLLARGGRVQAITQRERKRRHGRLEVRMLWALADPSLNAYLGSSGVAGRPWPYLAQVCRVERQRVVVRTGASWQTGRAR